MKNQSKRKTTVLVRKDIADVLKKDVHSDYPIAYAKAIISAIHEPILILDNNLIIIATNEAFTKTFKLTEKQTLQRSLSDLIDRNPSIQKLIQKLNKLSKQNTSFDEYELTYTFNNIGERTLLINAQHITFEKQQTGFILMGIEDITKRKLIEQQKDDFVSYVTHELKTPLTAISAFVQILEGHHRKTGDKKSQFLLPKVLSQVNRLHKLLSSFGTVYRTRNGKAPIRRKHFDFNALLHEVIEAFQYTTSSHHLMIRGELKQSVFADKERLHEVLVNLITNAIKYSPEGKNIIVHLEETASETIVRVEDFGKGIAYDDQEKIFDRFYRAESKEKIDGLGLGLYIVADIIKQHKGRIELESAPQKGATFSFILPNK